MPQAAHKQALEAPQGERRTATPDAAPSPSQLRRSGLDVQAEVHDRHQVEIRFNYAMGVDEGPQRYSVDAYFFIPRNVGANRSNFSKEQFYGDVTALMRLDAAALPLLQLADERNPASPLSRFAEGLEAFRASPRPPSSRAVAVHVKLYAYLFTLGVKQELAHLGKLVKDAHDAASHALVEREIEEALKRVRVALREYRRVRAGFWSYEKLSHPSFPETMRAADEYMSLFLEERLTFFVTALQREERHLDGSGFVARCRLIVAQLAREEAAHRHKYGYLVMRESTLREGEYFTFRASLLKKAVQAALYLDTREVRRDTFVRNAIGSVGAALAAIWALATQLPATLAEVSGGTKMLFFAAAVLAYVTKDRIKAITNEILTRRLASYDHTSWLEGESLRAVGLGMLLARTRELMRFLHLREVPEDIVAMRLARRTVRQAEVLAEEIIHYRKQLEVRTRDEGEHLPDTYSVRDILRLNVRHFITRLDDPLDRVAYFDAARDAFATADLPKVYHLNIVLKITRENAQGQGQERLEHLLVVLSKDGVVRVEEVNATGLQTLQGERRRLPIPTRLRWLRKAS